MKADVRGFIIEDLKEGEKIVKIPMNKEQANKLNEANKNVVQPEVFLIKFIGAENFKRAEKAMSEALENSLPKGVKEKCKWCLNESKEESDKACKKYELQAFITFKFMAVEFVDVIRSNHYVYNNKNLRFKLTEEFFKSMIYYNGRGIMAVDMGRLMGKVLELGLLSINQMFLQTNMLSKNLRMINHSLHALNTDSLPYKFKGIEIPEFITKQQDFFREQQEFYNEEQRLNREQIFEKAKKLNSNSNSERPYRTDIAYFCYYTSQSKELALKNTFPSKKAWGEIAELFGKDSTNIQKAYNSIYGNREERLKPTRTSNINYVIDNMLDDFPKAKKLALEELKFAEIN
jgi:hypothetical protein